MDARRLKGLEIAARCRIEKSLRGDRWYVPSQSIGGARYVVSPNDPNPSCSCPDFELRGAACKHVFAVRFAIEREKNAAPAPEPLLATEPVSRKPTYRQNWKAYNAAQAVEKDRFQELLFDLCRTVDQAEHTGRGRKPHTTRDSLFAMVFKVYGMFSARRFSSDLRTAHERGFLSKPVPGLKSAIFMEDDKFVPLLKQLIVTSSLPLRAVETTFAIDSSGFGSNRFERWFDQKYGVTRQTCVWVKCHLACGTKTNIVTAVRILDKESGDSPQFVPLVKDTARNFTIGEVSADKAYASYENFEAVAGMGAEAFLAFKNNTTGAQGGEFGRMFHYFQFKKDEYLQRYHRRSNVESTFSAIKRKFGDAVRSKTDTAMTNEVLCKVLAHNICVVIQEQHELGIAAEFSKPSDAVKSA